MLLFLNEGALVMSLCKLLLFYLFKQAVSLRSRSIFQAEKTDIMQIYYYVTMYLTESMNQEIL